MKTNIFKTVGRKMRLGIFLPVALTFFVVSCEKDNLTPKSETENPEIGFQTSRENTRPGPDALAFGDASIAETAIESGFDELVGALVYVDKELGAGLVNLFLNGKDQFTVFAPTNEAFKALYVTLGVGAITDLSANLVLDVLLYHVVEGRRGAVSVLPPDKPVDVTTLLGKAFSVSPSGQLTDSAGKTVNIVVADIPASNGMIHVIDGVLLPLEPSNKLNI